MKTKYQSDHEIKRSDSRINYNNNNNNHAEEQTRGWSRKGIDVRYLEYELTT